METKKEEINPYPMSWNATLTIFGFNSLSELIDYLENSGGIATVKIYPSYGGRVGVLIDRWIAK